MAGLQSLFTTTVSMLNTSVETASTMVECASNGAQALANASNEWVKLQTAKHEALKTVRISEVAREIISNQIKESKKVEAFLQKNKDFHFNDNLTLRDGFDSLVNVLEKATK